MATLLSNLSCKVTRDFTRAPVMSFLIIAHHDFIRQLMENIQDLVQQVRIEVEHIPDPFKEFESAWNTYYSAMFKHLSDEEQSLGRWFENLEDNPLTNGIAPYSQLSHVAEHFAEHVPLEKHLQEIRAYVEQVSKTSGFLPVFALLAHKLKQLDNDLREHALLESSIVPRRPLITP